MRESLGRRVGQTCGDRYLRLTPKRGTRGHGAPLMIVFLPPRKEQTTMRVYTFLFRLGVLMTLVLASAFVAGWKWGHAY
jgi:hypothetical protein